MKTYISRLGGIGLTSLHNYIKTTSQLQLKSKPTIDRNRQNQNSDNYRIKDTISIQTRRGAYTRADTSPCVVDKNLKGICQE